MCRLATGDPAVVCKQHGGGVHDLRESILRDDSRLKGDGTISLIQSAGCAALVEALEAFLGIPPAAVPMCDVALDLYAETVRAERLLVIVKVIPVGDDLQIVAAECQSLVF